MALAKDRGAVGASDSRMELLFQSGSTLRAAVDAMEVLTAREYWPMPTYGDLTFRI